MICAKLIILWTSQFLCCVLCLLSARFIVSCLTVLQWVYLVLLSESEYTSVTYLYYKTHIDVPFYDLYCSVKQRYNTALIVRKSLTSGRKLKEMPLNNACRITE
jgi:hypothetical protein